MNWSETLSVISILIALATFIINIKNRKTNRENLKLNKNSFDRNNMNFFYIESKKLTNEFQVKLALFNPSSTKLIINCVKVYVEDSSKKEEWRNLEIKWWPSEKDEFNKEKLFREEYKNLLVKDSKNIFINIGGEMEYKNYRFEVFTSFDEFTHITTITGTDTGFPIDYKKITTGNNV